MSKKRKPKTIRWTSSYVQAAHNYALSVVQGKIPAGKFVKAACKRQLDDLKRKWQWTYSEEEAGRICRFIEQLPHVKGEKAGTNIQLEPWQCFILCTVFGWINSEGKRRFRRAYSEVPRGNAKSTLSSGVGLYCVGADGEGGAEVYSAATTRDQARIVFRDAQHMAKQSRVCKHIGLEVVAHNIHQVKTASKFEALASDSSTLEGLNVHCGIIDELHAHKTREVYDVIETGTGKRLRSLLWCITTAGSNRAGICYEVRDYCIKVLKGVVQDDSQFAIIYTIDDGDDWTAPETWQKANPNWGVSVQPDIVAQLASKAMQMPAAQANFKTKHLNVWVNADSAWMDMRAWDRCGDKGLKQEQFEKEGCTIGLDLASKTDIAAKIKCFRRMIDDVAHYYAFGTYYLPEAAVTDGRNSQYSGWEAIGRLVTTPGDVLDFGRVEDELIDDQGHFDIRVAPFDPWQATQLAQRMMEKGLPMTEFRNTVANFSAPMKEIDALVRAGRFHHDGDPILAWMVSNVVCHMDNKENIYPRKERPENKIDGVVALIMALGSWMVTAEPGDFDGFLSSPVIA